MEIMTNQLSRYGVTGTVLADVFVRPRRDRGIAPAAAAAPGIPAPGSSTVS